MVQSLISMETSFHITPYLRKQLAQNTPRLAFSAANLTAWEGWRRELRNKLYALLGPWPTPSPIKAATIALVDAGSHWREEVILSSEDHPDISGYLLLPKRENLRACPAILALHGHGPGKAEVVGLEAGDAQQPYGLRMVEAGYIVFSFDFFPFGTRKETDHNAREGYEYACNSTLIRTLLSGYNLLTLNLFDVMRSLDFVSTRPEVDPQRIGVMGCSYGGTTSMYSAILDMRIKAAVLSCSLGEYRGHGVELDELCGAQVVPGILQWAEMGDVAGLLAPMPVMVECARGDIFFPWEYTQPSILRLREVYDVAGSENHLQICIYDGGHRYYGNGVIEFWKHNL
jgi:dienelactone hydrolase